MLNNNIKQSEIELSSKENNDDMLRKTYQKPLLEELGDLRTLTLGGTVVTPGDSGPSGAVYFLPV